MIVDARSLPPGESIDADLCIIGAGAAGITIAREIAGSGQRVCLLESGGYDFDGDTQNLYAGETAGQAYHPLDTSRLRFFGGTTNHWAGYCRPLDRYDFEPRAWIADSGWPITRAALDPFYRRAQTICELSTYAYDVATWRTATYRPYDLDAAKIVSDVFQIGPPTRFGSVYRDDIARAQNVRALLHANVVEIEVDDTRVTGLKVATLDGKKFTARAARYVLAAGTIENARMLLASNSTRPAGIGNTHDNVGRYFMDHPVVWKSGQLVTDGAREETRFYTGRQLSAGTWVCGFFGPSEEVQRREGVYGCEIFLDDPYFSYPPAAILSAKHILRAARQGRWPDDFATHIGRMIGDFGDLVDAAYRKTMDPPARRLITRFWSEVPPDRDSRVTLGDERDALGMRRVRLDWRLPAGLKHTYTRVHELLGQEVGARGIGRLQIGVEGSVDRALQEVEGSFHQMGTTRMHADPRKGVVDADCRVHDVANLWIAGSSLFPTYGHANPTLTIVALATRLADDLKRTG